MFAHVAEVQVLLRDGEVRLKGRYLLAQDEQLLDEEQLAVQRPAPCAPPSFQPSSPLHACASQIIYSRKNIIITQTVFRFVLMLLTCDR